MSESDKNLHHAPCTDSIAVAEQMTGASCKEDEAMLGLGILMPTGHNAHKHQVLEDRGNTKLRNDLDRYLYLIGEEGFQKILEIDFITRETAEKFFVFYHYEDGILLSFDTYDGDSVNGGKYRYNIKPNVDRKDFSKCVSSGSYTEHNGEKIWVGGHDCREAPRFHLALLREKGTFVKDWVKSPFFWLLHHGDANSKSDYDTINAERLSMFPEEVQKAILSQL